MLFRYSFTIWILILVGNILWGVSSWAKSLIQLNAGFESIYLRPRIGVPWRSLRIDVMKIKGAFNPTKKRFLIREISTRSIGCVSVSLIPPPIHSLSIQYWQPLRIPWDLWDRVCWRTFLGFQEISLRACQGGRNDLGSAEHFNISRC